jgi:rhodanese-related sulfurtransferase
MAMAVHRLMVGVRQGTVLLITGLALGAAFNGIRTDGLPWKGAWSPSAVAEAQYKGLQVISAKEAWSLQQAGQALFLDARDPFSFQEGHLPGALNVPPEEARAFAEDLKGLAQGGMQLIAYCDGKDCPLSPELARALQSLGVPLVRVLVDGWSRWREEGFPVEKGER